jgi:hypothetical protein
MSYNKTLIQNSATLSYFEHLQAENKKPQLAIYKGRTFMVTSYEAHGILEKIGLLFLKIQVSIFDYLKILDRTEKNLNELKLSVSNYHFSKCVHLRNFEVKSIEEECEKIMAEKSKTLEGKCEVLIAENLGLKAEYQQLNTINNLHKESRKKLEVLLANLREENKLLDEENTRLQAKIALLKQNNIKLKESEDETLRISEDYIAKYDTTSKENTELKKLLQNLPIQLETNSIVTKTINLNQRMDNFLKNSSSSYNISARD